MGELAQLGAYAKKQLSGSNLFLKWSHSARFAFAQNIVAQINPSSVLDYGCGDGTFLYSLSNRVKERVGYDRDDKQINDCRSRFSKSSLNFWTIRELENAARKFDFVSCMEVLEHCTESQSQMVIKNLGKFLGKDGLLLISVPIEIGPTLLFKEIIRTLLSKRKGSGYEFKDHYSTSEMISGLLANRNSRLNRPIYSVEEINGSKNTWHSHKGFNWRALRAELERSFEIEKIKYTPFDLSFGFFSSQVWFFCRHRDEP